MNMKQYNKQQPPQGGEANRLGGRGQKARAYIAYCLKRNTYTLLPAYCLFRIGYRLLPTGNCLLPVAYCLWHIACRLLRTAYMFRYPSTPYHPRILGNRP